MKIGYLLHSPVPGPTTNAEQAVNSLAALAARPGVDLDLCVPAPEGPAAAPQVREADVERYYGIAAGSFGPRLHLRDVPLPGWAHGNLRGILFDLRLTGWVRERGGYDALYVRDPFTLLRALPASLPVIFETYRTDINRLPQWAPFRRLAYAKRNLAGVIVHSRVAWESFREAGFTEERLLVAYNGYRAGDAGILSQAVARTATGLASDRPIVCYTGGVGPHKGSDELAALAALVPEALFVMVGAAPDAQLPASWARIENLRVLPRVPPAVVASYLAAADVLIIPPTAGPLRQSSRTVLPIKTFAYLAAGRPILAPDLPDVGEVLSDRNALVVAPDDLPAAAAALRRLLGDPALRDRLSAAATESAREYTWEARAIRVAAFLERRLSPGGGEG